MGIRDLVTRWGQSGASAKEGAVAYSHVTRWPNRFVRQRLDVIAERRR
jgi:hypothetical protein